MSEIGMRAPASYLHMISEWLQKVLTRKKLLLVCMLTAFCAGMLAHGFTFTNKLYSSADELFYYADIGSLFFDLGRFGLDLLWRLGVRISVPWFSGLIGIVLLGLSATAICSAVGLRRMWQAMIVSAVIVTHPVIMTSYSYMYSCLGCMTSIFLCSVSLWLFCRTRFGYLWSIPLLIIVTSMYQVFIMFMATLLVLYIIRAAVLGEASGKSVVLLIGKSLLSIGLSVAVYLLINKALIALNISNMMSQQGMDKMGQLDITKIPHQMGLAYRKFLDYFFLEPMGAYNIIGKAAQATVIFVGFAGLIIYSARAFISRRIIDGFALLACAAVLPLTATGVYMLTTNEVHAHHLTLLPYIPTMMLPVFISPIHVCKKLSKRISCVLLTLTLAIYGVLTYEYAIVDNQAYFRTYLAVTRAQNFGNRLYSRIETREDYEPGRKIYFIGNCQAGDDALIFYESEDVIRFGQMMFYTPYEQSIFTNCVGHSFMRNVMGLPIDGDYTWEPTEQEKERVAQMPCYPSEGSIELMRDTYIIKFSD